LTRAFPVLVWSRLVSELQSLDGVLFLRPEASRVTLIIPLRLELRQFLVQHTGTPPPVEEPEAIP